MTADHPAPKAAAQLRAIGILILLLGLGGAGAVYWTGKAPEDLSSNPDTARDYKMSTREAERHFGELGLLSARLMDWLKRPGVRAVLILLASAIAAAGCFYVAHLLALREKAALEPAPAPELKEGK